ncbi:hypothetical protein C7Y72_20060 [Paraconexibacter algicola]|uniref:CobW C-terminal domain-containing protein n=2 Tax=Paraconexibacter algicola TaxID=2133960 RepID=A0A2T4UCD8_9ACTN|nr:hypothetical protein C7Y72_20060 [Paraconexibacter algicola]
MMRRCLIMGSVASTRPLPALLLTGFLGAGKTTALNALMAARPDLRVGVIENEAGAEGVDSDLLQGAARVVEIAGGCACCTVRGALSSALELLAERTDELDLVVVEASGIADPVPIAQAFQVPAVRGAIRIAATVCVVDVPAVAAADLLPHVWGRQLRFADQVLLTKADRVSGPRLAAVRRRVREHAPHAGFVAGLDDPAVLAPGATGAPPVIDAPRASDPSASSAAGDGHGFAAHALRVATPLDAHRLEIWVREAVRRPGVLRVKGVVAVRGRRRPVVVQGTPQGVALAEARGPVSARGSRLVVIGTDLDPVALQAELDGCAGARPDRAPGAGQATTVSAPGVSA